MKDQDIQQLLTHYMRQNAEAELRRDLRRNYRQQQRQAARRHYGINLVVLLVLLLPTVRLTALSHPHHMAVHDGDRNVCYTTAQQLATLL